MVVWSEYYRFSAEEVEAIDTSEQNNSEFPCVLTVYLKSGNKLSICYVDKNSRKIAMIDLSRQIDAEKKQRFEGLQNTLHILEGTVNRMDRRQLRIWQQLKRLLGIKEGDDQ